jgi:hypothetical protein
MYRKLRYACYIFISSLLIGGFIGRPAHAILVIEEGGVPEAEILGRVDGADLAVALYNILLPIGIAVGIFAILMAGYTYMTSQGRPDKVKDASERLTSAVLGILFIVLSLVLLRVIVNALLDANLGDTGRRSAPGRIFIP